MRGKGLHGLISPTEILDVGNSGTTTRLISGILAGQEFSSRLDGDDSIRIPAHEPDHYAPLPTWGPASPASEGQRVRSAP